FFNCGTQMKSAITVTIPHTAKAPCQPNGSILASGTLTPEASAPKMFIITAYNPVIAPTRNGKLIFTIPGINTLQNEIAIPIKAVPINKVPTPVTERNTVPINKILIEIKIVRSRPNLCANLGAKGDTIAKASNGTVVMVPITELDTPKLSRII